MIDIQDLSLTYAGPQGPVHALKNINLHIQAGEVFGIIGRSGAGKSSLVRCMNLLNRPASGKMIVNGRDLLQLSDAQLRQARQEIGMVFQHFNLLSSRTVFDNAALPLELAGVSKAEIAQRITPLLELVGLAHLANRYPAQISGGQKQRVGIARALASNPRVLLSDEATSALDPETTRSILDLLQRIDASGSLSYRWLERLAFNTSSANSDAHAKNYSLILDPASGIRLSPQYDAVATRYWPEFNWELTMPLNEDHAFAEHTTPQDWEDLATRHGLDGSRVADMARRMAGKVLAGISESCEGLDARMADRLNACWTKANESIEPIMPGDEPANSLDPASALPDSLGFPSSGRTI